MDSLHRFLVLIGKWVSWLTLMLVVLMCVDVFLRYSLNTSKTWMIDLEWQIFATLFLLGGSYTLLADRHVRVDLIYERLSSRGKAVVDTVGTMIFLLPWCGVMLWTASDYTWNSWAIGEGSPDPNGLPARYIIKAVMWLAFLLLLLASIVKLAKDIGTVFQRPEKAE